MEEAQAEAFANADAPAEAPEATQPPEAATDTLFFNLTPGSTGSAVTSLQSRLLELGYLDMPSTLYDDATREAVMA